MEETLGLLLIDLTMWFLGHWNCFAGECEEVLNFGLENPWLQ